MRRLIVPFDGSEPSKAAFAIASDLADRNGAELVAVHAVEIPHVMLAAPTPSDTVNYLIDQGTQQWRKQLAELADQVPARVNLRTEVLVGPATVALLEFIAEEAPDLVLVGTHGVGGARRLLLGRVSQRLLESCEHPVLFVREGLPRPETSRILVGIDGSEDSKRALSFAARLASDVGAGLKLVTAFDPFLPGFGMVNLDELRQEFRDHAQGTLDQARASLPADLADITEEMREGRPGDELIEACADDPEVTLAVVGTRGHHGLSGLFIGSVARRLVNAAPVPVVVLSHQD